MEARHRRGISVYIHVTKCVYEDIRTNIYQQYLVTFLPLLFSRLRRDFIIVTVWNVHIPEDIVHREFAAMKCHSIRIIRIYSNYVLDPI